MAGGRVTRVLDWFHQESAGAPAALQARAARYLEASGAGEDLAEGLAAAATLALRATLEHPGGRDVALDLLAADALVTLALKARATGNPAGLAEFAARLRAVGAGAP
jgi:hypothetical protein